MGDDSIIVELEAIAPVTACSATRTIRPPSGSPKWLRSPNAIFRSPHREPARAEGKSPAPGCARTAGRRRVRPHPQGLCETIGGVLYLNPGYAGKPKFGAERTVAILRGPGNARGISVALIFNRRRHEQFAHRLAHLVRHRFAKTHRHRIQNTARPFPKRISRLQN